jgi:hypothetical protein
MKELSKEVINHLFTIDLERGIFYWKNPSKFHNEVIGKEAGCSRAGRSGKKYWIIKINGYPYKRGHLLFLFINGKFPSPCIDHINGNSLDDRPINLREATFLQNAWNHKSHKRRLKLPMGVRSQKSGNYEARITYKGKQLHLGAYKTVKEAELIYIAKRKELYANYSGY